MRWIAPLDRREITLILFAIIVYITSYNVDSTLHLIGLDPATTEGAMLTQLGLGWTNVIDVDGRKPPGRRDALELEVFGDWAWDEGQVAGDGGERSQVKGSGQSEAMWVENTAMTQIGSDIGDNSTVDQALVRWNDDLPRTSLVQHVPGYTILDNLYIYDGSVYVVGDDEHAFPPMHHISTGHQWKFIHHDNAKRLLGPYGGALRGVTWVSTDNDPHNSTLFSLWRTYSTLDPHISQSGGTKLPPPSRLFFPTKMFFSDMNPDFSKFYLRRRRTDIGLHPWTIKAAFPHLTVLYLQDWQDFDEMQVPFLVERVVIADRASASLAGTISPGEPPFSPPFSRPASEWWWQPVRRVLADYFGTSGTNDATVVTYLYDPETVDSIPEHDRLVKALNKLGKDSAYKVNIISNEAGWSERMEAIVQSTILLSVHGHHLMDGAFMEPSQHTTIMEFFPAGTFLKDIKLVADSLNMGYVAWWNQRRYSSKTNPNDVPPVTRSSDTTIHIDVPAVIQEIRTITSKH